MSHFWCYATRPYVECRSDKCHYALVVVPYYINEGKSAASFCLQVATLVLAMFCNFYLVKNHKIADNPATATTEAREIISTYLESLEF